MKVKREDVYKAIDSEREYQENLGAGRTDGRTHTVGEFLVMLQRYVDHAFAAWTDNAGDQAALNQVRKVAGIAVNCMEKHGAPHRK